MNLLPLLGGVGSLWKTVFGSKSDRDKYDADNQGAVHSQFAAEFRENRNWFDSLIDGLNRLPRPIFAYGTIYLFYLCWSDPDTFVAGAVNLKLMPQEGWWILGTIVVFFFGGRLHKDFGKYKIKESVLKKYKPSPEGLKQKREYVEKLDDDPQEGIEWEDRIEKRYKHESSDRYN